MEFTMWKIKNNMLSSSWKRWDEQHEAHKKVDTSRSSYSYPEKNSKDLLRIVCAILLCISC
jgi:hypothetical protein